MLSENYYLAYNTLNDYSNCLKGFAKDDSQRMGFGQILVGF